jgi:hypothetical protein
LAITCSGVNDFLGMGLLLRFQVEILTQLGLDLAGHVRPKPVVAPCKRRTFDREANRRLAARTLFLEPCHAAGAAEGND